MLPFGEARQAAVPGAQRLRLARAAPPLPRESLATLVIGALSTGLGVAALATLLVRHPHFDLVYAAVVGQWIGIGGIFISLRIGRGISPLCVLGTALCLVVVGPLYILTALFILGIASWVLLSIWAVRALKRGIGG